MSKKRKRARNGAPLAFILKALTWESDECLIWPYGQATTGYGRIRINGVSTYAHREVLWRSAGPPPPDKTNAAHAPEVCHNRLCCNPRHLRWATEAENAADRIPDGTENRGERNGKAQLDRAAVLAIRDDPRQHAAIALEYALHKTTVAHIKARRPGYWQWLD